MLAAPLVSIAPAASVPCVASAASETLMSPCVASAASAPCVASQASSACIPMRYCCGICVVGSRSRPAATIQPPLCRGQLSCNTPPLCPYVTTIEIARPGDNTLFEIPL